MNGVRAKAKAKAAEGIAGAVETGMEAWRRIGADGGEEEGGSGGGVAQHRRWVGFGAGEGGVWHRS